MKATAGGMKWVEPKLLTEARLGNRALVVAGAGRLRHIKDAIAWLSLEHLNERLDGDPSFDEFLGKVLELILPQFVAEHVGKYDAPPEIEMIIGAIDKDRKPRLVEVYSNGDYDYKETFAAIGSGSIFGEILLRKLYFPKMPVSLAKRLVGYIIWEIQDIDNNTGENMQIVCMDTTGASETIGKVEIEVYKHLPTLVAGVYEALRQRIENLQLEDLENALNKLQETLKKTSSSS